MSQVPAHTQDELAREQALDCEHSWLVQAPAGSGKTTLLVRRLIRLLTLVADPEQVLAVTFTRAAAAEMKQRLIEQLQSTAQTPELLALRQHDRRKGWDLCHNPQRLNVQTIDGFCLAIVRNDEKRHLRSLVPSNYAQKLYQQAAESVLAHLNDPQSRWHQTVSHYLALHGFQRRKASEHLISLLQSRDSWTPFLETPEPFAEHLAQNWHQFLTSCFAPLEELDDAANWFEAAGTSEHEPGPSRWRHTVEKLCTQKNEIRKKLPQDLQQSLSTFQKQQPELWQRLISARTVPEYPFSDAERKQTSVFVEVIKLAFASLTLCFKNQSDFTAIQNAAIQTLRARIHNVDHAHSLEPLGTLRHLLVDECQDLSIAQFQLLQLLVHDWYAGDGRTAFLVGDPMQSIYRFREAEVSIFRQLKRYGLSHLPLQNLSLQRNFRSKAGLIDALNRDFATICAQHHCTDDFQAAIAAQASVSPSAPECTTDSLASKTTQENLTPQLTLCEDLQSQSQRALERIESLLTQAGPHATTIAVLAQSRSSMLPIAQLLHRNQIDFFALGFEQAQQRPEVQQMLALKRAILDTQDRIAWLALLRAPFIGIDFPDLEIIARLAADDWILKLRQAMRQQALSADGCRRLQSVMPTLQNALELKSRYPVRDWLEAVWLQLGGEHTLSAQQQHSVLCVLAELEQNKPLDKSMLDHGRADSQVQLMTVHAAKGLEFDHVILLNMQSSSRSDARPFANVFNTLKTDGVRPLFSIHSQSSETNLRDGASQESDNAAMRANFLHALEQQQRLLETVRLLYVACTRARASLHFFASVPSRALPKTCLLSPLSNLDWVQTQFADAQKTFVAQTASASIGPRPRPRTTLLRLRNIQPLAQPHLKLPKQTETSFYPQLAYDSVSRIVGIVTHRLIQQQAQWQRQVTQADIIAHLEEAGLVVNLKDAARQILISLTHTFEGRFARWLWHTEHSDARMEWDLTTCVAGRQRRAILDYSFVDALQRRWVVDFKTTSYEGDSVSQFLLRQKQRHSQQMQGYTDLLKAQEPSISVLAALYFPLLDRRIAWLAHCGKHDRA